VLEAVKARPGKLGACRKVGAAANLDSSCARRRQRTAVRDEETALRSNKETDEGQKICRSCELLDKKGPIQGNRGKGHVRRCGVRYRRLSVARNFDFVAGGFSKNLGLEYMHNFSVMARVLLNGESRFLASCDFKGLRVIKRARFTTAALAASQHSLNSMARTGR
jgi:hypothetical protein